MQNLFGILTTNEALFSAVAAILAIIEYTFAPFRTFEKRWRKPDIVTIANPEALIPKPVHISGIQMDVASFTALQQKLRDNARHELAAAHGEERKRLELQIDGLYARLANPDEALAQQHAIIVKLEDELSRRGNDLGGDAVNAAKAALEAGDFTVARTLFETLAARTDPDVQTNADASFALGQIAEAEIRWHDAATHYARAARLNPNFETLVKAREFAWRAGDFPAALLHGEDLLALARKDGTQEQLAEALNEHALTISAQGRYAEAEALFTQALAIGRATIGEAHPDYATSLNNLAHVAQAQGRYAEAEALYTQALNVDRATIGKAHPDYATRLNNLAVVVQKQGRYAQAEELFTQALHIFRATIGNAHPQYAGHLNNLANVVQAQGRYAEAEALYIQAMNIDRATIGETHPDYAGHLEGLARVVNAQGRYTEAEELLAQSMNIVCLTIGEAHPDYVTGLGNLAGVMQAQGRYAEAEALYRQALGIIRKTLGDTHPNTKLCAKNLIDLLESLSPTAPDLPALRALRDAPNPQHPLNPPQLTP